MDIESFITDFKSQFIDEDEITVDEATKFHTIGSWDSLTAMSVLVMINDKYTPDFSYTQLDGCQTVKDIYDAIILATQK